MAEEAKKRGGQRGARGRAPRRIQKVTAPPSTRKRPRAKKTRRGTGYPGPRKK